MFTPSQYTPTTMVNGAGGYSPRWLGAPPIDSEGLAIAKLQAQNQLALQGGQLAFQGGQAGAERAFQGGQNDANRAMQTQIGMAPWAYKDKVFGTFSPLLQGLLGSGGSSFGGTPVGGQSGAPPQISAAPVWSPTQIDQQVNAAKAGNEQKAQQQRTDNMKSTAASGFGSRSPLLQALNSSVGMQTQASNTDADRNIRYQAAAGNAQQVLAGQQAQEGQYRDVNDQDIRRRQTNNQFTTSLAGLLAGLL